MRYPTLTLALACTAVIAEEVLLFVPDTDHGTTMGMVASKIDSDADATTWLVGCNAESGNDQCNFQRPVTVTQGPTTAHYRRDHFSSDNDEPFAAQEYWCSFATTTSLAYCTIVVETIHPTYMISPISTQSTISSSDLRSMFQRVPIVTAMSQIYNTGVDSTHTKTSEDASETETKTEQSSGTESDASMITAKPSLPSQAATDSQFQTATSTGLAAQFTLLSGWVVGAVGAVVAVAAL